MSARQTILTNETRLTVKSHGLPSVVINLEGAIFSRCGLPPSWTASRGTVVVMCGEQLLWLMGLLEAVIAGSWVLCIKSFS